MTASNSLSCRRQCGPFRSSGVAALTGSLVLIAATPAAAYVGPGAGLSLLGALWGVVAALAVALAFVVIWPLRRLFARRGGQTRSRRQTGSQPDRQGGAS